MIDTFEQVIQGYAATCHWYYGDFGDLVHCPQDQAIFGRCGSGTHLDCVDMNGGANQCQGVMCCEVEVVDDKPTGAPV